MAKVVSVATLDWPDSPLETASVQRVGQSFLNYSARESGLVPFLHWSTHGAVSGGSGDDAASDDGAVDPGGKKKKAPKERELLSLKSEALAELTHYQLLGDIPMHASAERVKRAYRRACLKYHPDKTGRGEEDEVFLAVKAAFDCLSEPQKRKSYDSTVDFDDSIPREGEVQKFYKKYGPVFERNLRFASFNDPTREADDVRSSGKKKKGKKGRGRPGDMDGSSEEFVAPELGDDSTPMAKVHAFYDFWTHFESWRDFTLKAAEVVEHDVEMADSRDEKRWMAKEIDRKSKAMKKEEVARIALLVERAIAVDPRLRREREGEKEAKRKAIEEKQRKKAVEEKIIKEEETKRENERLEKETKEKKEKAIAKKAKEQEKKQLRKARQLLRRSVIAAYEQAPDDNKVWDNIVAMNDDLELLCDTLEIEDMVSLSDTLGGVDEKKSGSGKPDLAALIEVQNRATGVKKGEVMKSQEAKKQREKGRAEAAEKEAVARAAKASRPFTKGELSALAKGVKKYPPGGANRWEGIAMFINNICRPEEPRTKEECIEKYNQVASQQTKPGGATASSGTGGGVTASSASTELVEDWTEEQDRKLQEALAKFPPSMNKNERWTSIAKANPGKSKKDCVQRFKAIREALKQKK